MEVMGKCVCVGGGGKTLAETLSVKVILILTNTCGLSSCIGRFCLVQNTVFQFFCAFGTLNTHLVSVLYL